MAKILIIFALIVAISAAITTSIMFAPSPELIGTMSGLIGSVGILVTAAYETARAGNKRSLNFFKNAVVDTTRLKSLANEEPFVSVQCTGTPVL